MNNDNDLNLHLHDQMSGWLRYCTTQLNVCEYKHLYLNFFNKLAFFNNSLNHHQFYSCIFGKFKVSADQVCSIENSLE